MPQLRTFSSYAPTPDFAGAYTSGFQAMSQLGQANAQIQLGKEKIAAEQAQAGMELQAKREALAAQSARAAQELEVEKAYKENMLGLKQRELDQAQSVMDLKVKEAAAAHEAQQLYQQEAAQLISGGMKADDAYMRSALKHGPALNLPGSVYSQAFERSGDSGPALGTMVEIPGVPREVAEAFVGGKGSRQYIKKAPEGAENPPPPGYIKWGDRVIPEREPREVADLKRELNRLVKKQDEDGGGQLYSDRAKSGEKELTKSQRVVADRYDARASEIRALKEKLASSKEKPESSEPQKIKAPPGAKEGDKVRSKKGFSGTVRGGFIVLDDKN